MLSIPGMLDPLPPDQRPTSAPELFRPRHCPWPGCPAHLDRGAPTRFPRAGWYRRKAAPRRIPRFRCPACGRTFSSQSFSPTRFMKRPELLVPAARLLVNGCADRHVRRALPPNPRFAPQPNVAAAASTLSRLVPRLAREAALLLAELEARAAERGLGIPEPLALDDFETFAQAQLLQVAVPTAVGRDTAYVYQLDQAPHRRGGRRSPAQRDAERALARAGAFPRAARRRAWSRVRDALLAALAPGQLLRCASDGAPEIAAAFDGAGPRVRHRPLPNPPRRPKGAPRGPAARARDRAVGPADRFHRWCRHSLAHDRRETIAFARSVNALLARKILFAAARNAVQPRSERRPRDGTPAMARGLLDRPLGWDEILELRRFPRRLPPLPPGWAACRDEAIPTAGRLPSRRRLPAHAR